MKLIKYIGVLLFTVVILFLFVANFSSVSSSFECVGKVTSKGNVEPKTIYIVIEEYRWWVGLWSDSDGMVKLEIPNEVFEVYLHVIEAGEQLRIYESPNKIKGNFSKLSKVLALQTPLGFFDGKCKVIK
ncbi:MAG: hypothetical protein COA93_03905 [Alphaproteobacteria bacterium]|nr:MAG: hypothetical protein COA93_03905 [Alphaproteobacteria bacterium]